MEREQQQLREEEREQLIQAYRHKLVDLSEPYDVGVRREIYSRLLPDNNTAVLITNIKAVCERGEPTEPFIKLAPHEDPDMIADSEVEAYYNLYFQALTQLKNSGYCPIAESL